MLPLTAQQIQRSGRGRRHICRVHRGLRHIQQFQNRSQCGAYRHSGRAARPAQPQKVLRCRESLIKADLFAYDTVLKTVGQFRALCNHGVAVRMGQKAGVTGCLGELPFRKPEHKNRLGFGQTHPAGRGKDYTVHALRNMAQIRCAEQEGEQVIVLCGRYRVIPGEQANHLVKQRRHNVPFPQCFVCAGKFALTAEFFRQ